MGRIQGTTCVLLQSSSHKSVDQSGVRNARKAPRLLDSSIRLQETYFFMATGLIAGHDGWIGAVPPALDPPTSSCPESYEPRYAGEAILREGRRDSFPNTIRDPGHNLPVPSDLRQHG